MKDVSQEFLDAMKKRTNRKLKFKAEVQWNLDYTNDASYDVSADEVYGSVGKQLFNEHKIIPGKYLTCDSEHSLNGDFCLAPATAGEISRYETGMWLQDFCDASGNFATPQIIEIEFSTRPMNNVFLTGRKKIDETDYDEYPRDFSIKFYDGSNLEHTLSVIDNDKVTYHADVNAEELWSVNKIIIEITRWSATAGHQVKLSRFFASYEEIYTDSDIFSVEYIAEREISEGGMSVPIGNISASECDIVLRNDNNKFNFDNENSVLYGRLKPAVEVALCAGVEKEDGQDEYVKLCTMYTEDYFVDENGITATLRCKDLIHQLGQRDYDQDTFVEDTNLKIFIKEMLLNIGIREDQFFIDSELESINIPFGFVPRKDVRSALSEAVAAGVAFAYADGDGVLQIESSEFLNSEKTEKIIDIEDYEIFDKKIKTNMQMIKNRIILTANEYYIQDTEEKVFKDISIEIPAGESVRRTIRFSKNAIHNPRIRWTTLPGIRIVYINYFSWGAEFEIENSSGAAETVNIHFLGFPVIKEEDSPVIQIENLDSIAESGVREFEYENRHVQNFDVGNIIANLLLSSYTDFRKDIKITWRGNFALDLGDRIGIRNFENALKEYHITSQKFSYSAENGLESELRARRAE